MMGALGKIVYLTESQYSYLVSNGSITVNGRTIAYNSNDLYVTPQTQDIPSAYTSNPEMDGTASAGSSANWAMGDHVHPTDTTRAAATSVPTQASVGSTGIVTFSNSGGTSLFTVQLPLYTGGVS